MNTKLFVPILVLLVVVAAVYVYDTAAAITSRSTCADYAVNLTVQSFPDSFEETRDAFPPKRLKAEASQDAQANYNLFFGYCMDRRGVAR